MSTKSMNKKGFTLIELLIVVVIIGILAAIAIPRFGATRERAFVSAMQSDLRNLQTAQEQYYQANNFQYASTAADLTGGTAPLLTLSDNVGNLTLVAASAGTGYTASVTHSSLPADRNACGVAVGTIGDGTPTVNPTVGTASNGVIACNYNPPATTTTE